MTATEIPKTIIVTTDADKIAGKPTDPKVAAKATEDKTVDAADNHARQQIDELKSMVGSLHETLADLKKATEAGFKAEGERGKVIDETIVQMLQTKKKPAVDHKARKALLAIEKLLEVSAPAPYGEQDQRTIVRATIADMGDK